MHATKVERPALLAGRTVRVHTGCGYMYVILNGTPVFEVFAALGKSGSCARTQLEALTRMVTLALKYGVPADEIVSELENLKCPNPVWENGAQVTSCADGIAKTVKEVACSNGSDTCSLAL